MLSLDVFRSNYNFLSLAKVGGGGGRTEVTFFAFCVPSGATLATSVPIFYPPEESEEIVRERRRVKSIWRDKKGGGRDWRRGRGEGRAPEGIMNELALAAGQAEEWHLGCKLGKLQNGGRWGEEPEKGQSGLEEWMVLIDLIKSGKVLLKMLFMVANFVQFPPLATKIPYSREGCTSPFPLAKALKIDETFKIPNLKGSVIWTEGTLKGHICWAREIAPRK